MRFAALDQDAPLGADNAGDMLPCLPLLISLGVSGAEPPRIGGILCSFHRTCAVYYEFTTTGYTDLTS